MRATRSIRLVGFALLVAAAALAQDEEVLRRGTQLHVRRDRALGVVSVDPAAGDRPARARVSVSAGPYSFVAVLSAGARVRLAGTTLEVVAVEPPTAVRVRRAPGGGPDEPLRAAPAEQDGRLLLEPLAIYTLPDGRAVGVGNVRPDGDDGAAVVTLTVFPPGYREDPSRGYDLHVDAAAGNALEGAAARVRVVRLELDQGDRPGVVELALRPPG